MLQTMDLFDEEYQEKILSNFTSSVFLDKSFNLNENQILKPCAAGCAGGAGF